MIRGIGNILSKLFIPKRFLVAAMLCVMTLTFAPTEAKAENCPTMEVLKERYQSDCFPCQIVQVLVSSFMKAADKVYTTSKEAGNKLLLLGTIIWLVFWALKKLSSFTNPEPMAMVNELLIFVGKIVLAYCFLTAGTSALVGYTINPILGAGADFGTALMLESKTLDVNSDPKPENSYKGPTEIISPVVMNKILKFSESVSNEVATNLIIGNALTCFAIENGFHWKLFIEFTLPDMWLLLCGIIIWCIGFMLTLSICYYLIDIPFKLGFAVIALPVVIGLWPFKMTSGKLKSCIDIILNAAGTFLFLALSTSYAMRLVSEAFNVGEGVEVGGDILTGKDALYYAFEKDKVKYVQKIFDMTGPYFLILIFCYIYAIKMISEVSEKFPSKFFSGGFTGGASPMHQMATGATTWLGKKAMAPVKLAGDIVANQAGKMATTAAKAAGNVGIGAAGGAVGWTASKAGQGVRWAGSKLATQSKNAKQGLDDQQQQNQRLGQGSIMSTLSNRTQALGASLGAKIGNATASTGNFLDKNGQALQKPGQNTLNRVKNAYNFSADELKKNATELAGAIPTGVGEALNKAGQFYQKQAEKGGTIQAGQNNVSAPGVALTNKLGQVLQRAGNAIVNNEAQNTRQDHTIKAGIAQQKFVAAGGRLATYVPPGIGEGVQMVGNRLQESAQNGNGVQAVLASKFGGLLNKSGGFMAENKASEGTLRHKIMNIDPTKLKTVFTGRAIVTGLNAVKDRTVTGLGNVAEKATTQFNQFSDEFNQDKIRRAEEHKTKRQTLKNNLKHFGKNTKGSLTTGAKDLRSSFIELTKNGSFKGLKSNAIKDAKSAVSDLGESTLDLGKTAFIAEPKNTIMGIGDEARIIGTTTRDVYGYDKKKGAELSVKGAVFALAASPLVVGNAIRNVGINAVDSTYNVTEKAMMTTIDLAKTVIAVSQVKNVGRVVRDVGVVTMEAGKMVLSPVGMGVSLGADLLGTAHSAVKRVTRPTAQIAGAALNVGIVMPIGFAAKMVDESLYQSAKAVEKTIKTVARPFTTAGETVLRGAQVGYHTLAATQVGQGVSRTLHAGGATLKVGVGVLKMGRNIIKGAAGEGGYSNNELSAEERKKRREENKKQREKDDRKEKDKLAKQESAKREREQEEQQREERRIANEERERAERERLAREAEREERQREEREQQQPPLPPKPGGGSK